MKDRPHNLPQPASQFVGREELLSALTAAVAKGRKVITLVGTGGAGKTRLAVEFGHRHLAASDDGVWFCDLMDVSSEPQLLAAMAATMSLSEHAVRSTAQLADLIADQAPALYILDNLEQIPQIAVRVLEQWRTAAPDATFLITSRRPLLMAEEEVLTVDPLPVPEPGLPLSALARVPSVALFVSRAHAVRPEFQLNADNAESVGSLMRALDGLPLAIELAAARSRVLSPAGMLQRLGDRFSLLAAGRRGASQRKASLRGALEASWRLLAPWERTALAQLAVFRGGWTGAAAEEVLDLGAWEDAPHPLDVVQGLVDHGLVHTRPGAMGSRFGMYTHIAEFAAKQDDSEGDGDGVFTPSRLATHRSAALRHSQHFGTFAERFLREVNESLHAQSARAVLREEQENLVVACEEACANGDSALATALASALHCASRHATTRQRAMELGHRALALPSPGAERRADLLIALSEQHARLGQTREALELAEEAVALAPPRSRALARAKRTKGAALSELGREAEAETALDEALALARQMGDEAGQAHTLGALAGIAFRGGAMERAETLAMQALAGFRILRDVMSEGIMLSNLADIASARGGWVEAERRYQAALVVARTSGLPAVEGHILGNLCGLAVARGQLAEAESLGLRALERLRSVGDRRMELFTLVNYADAELQLGRYLEARAHASDVLADNPREIPLRASALAVFAEATAALSAREHVDGELDEAEALFEGLGDRASQAAVMLRRARVRRLQGDQAGLMAELARYDAMAPSLPSSSVAAMRPMREALTPFDELS